jgi:predicted exporter
MVRLLMFARQRRWTVLAAVTALSILAVMLSLRLSFGTDVLALLPQNDPSLQAFRQYLDRFGAADHLYIVFETLSDVPIEDASNVTEAYLRRLRALPEIAKIDAGLFEPDKDWTYLQDRTFVLIGPSATREALDRFSEQGLRAALIQSRDLLGTPSQEIRQFVQSDPLGLLALVRDRFAGDRLSSVIQASRRGYLSADGRSRLVIATPAGPPFDTAFCRRLFARLTQIESEIRTETASNNGRRDEHWDRADQEQPGAAKDQKKQKQNRRD